MAATHPPELSRTARREPTVELKSRSDRDREKREHQSERWFALWFFVVVLFTIVYLVARSPIASGLMHHL